MALNEFSNKTKLVMKFELLGHDGKIIKRKVTSCEVPMDRFDCDQFMKAMNVGDISLLSNPFSSRDAYSLLGFVNMPDDFKVDPYCAHDIETEPISGLVKFSIFKDGKSTFKWEYV